MGMDSRVMRVPLTGRGEGVAGGVEGPGVDPLGGPEGERESEEGEVMGGLGGFQVGEPAAAEEAR